MATAALLRSIRRRDVASAPFSVYECLSSNGKTSCGSSFIGQNWIGLSRAFSSKAAGTDVIGIDLGTINSCVAVMEGKLIRNGQPSQGSSYIGQNYASLGRAFSLRPVGNGLGTPNEGKNPKAVDNAGGARITPSFLFNQKRELVMGLPSFGTKHLFSTKPDDPQGQEEQSSPKQQAFRPLSPHLPVYKPQMNSMLSIFNRITGAYLSGIILFGFLLFMKMGPICLTYPSFYQFLFVTSKQMPVFISVTALAMLYHTVIGAHALMTHEKPFPNLFR